MKYNIPHFGLDRQYRNIKSEILEVTNSVLESGSYVAGEYTHRFTDWLQIKTKTDYAVVTHSGTQALEIMALYYKRTAGVYNDDILPRTITPYDKLNVKICIPNITYPATFNAFLNAYWQIKICDTDQNGLLNMDHVSATDFACVVGLYGASPDIGPPASRTIVDGAQHWLVANGNVGDGMAISFDPTKNLPASGNGGAIVTNCKGLAEFALDYTRNGKVNSHVISGTNSTMSELDCAHLLVRAKYINTWQERRKYIRNYWIEQFKDLPIRCLSKGIENHADQKFVIYASNRDELHSALLLNRIDCRVHYHRALSELPVVVAHHSGPLPDMISTSVLLTRGVLSLPIYPELTDAEVEIIATNVKAVFA